MKNHIFIVILIPIITLSSLPKINGAGISNTIKPNDNTESINRLKGEKKELREEIRLCNGLNIVISVLGLTAGVSGIIGTLFKDKVLELTGAIGSTISAALLITTNCMQCCQNPSDDDIYDKDFGDL